MKETQKLNIGLLISSCLIMLQHGIIMLLLGPMVPEIMETFGIGESSIGLLMSAGSLGFAIGPVIGGILIDRRGLKLAITLGFGLETVFLILFGFTPLFILAVLINFCLIFMAGQVETTANYIPTIVGGKSAGAVMNLVHFFFSVSAFVGPFCIGIFLSRGGRWQTVFLAAAVPTFILAMLFLILKLNGKPNTNNVSQFSFRHMFKAAKHPAVIFGALTLMLYVGAELGFSVWIVNYLEKELLFPKIHASFGLSLLWIGIMLGRLGNAAATRKLSGKVLMLAAAILGVVSGIFFMFVRALPAVYITTFCIGLAMSGVFPNTMSTINRCFPDSAGLVTGLMTLGGGVGAMIFQWLIGITAEHAGLRISMIFTPVLMGLTAVTFFLAVYFLKRDIKKQ